MTAALRGACASRSAAGSSPAPRAPLFETPRGRVTGGEGGATYEAWVVDVRGAPLLVWAGWTRSAPASEVAALLATVDSVALCDQHRTACGRLQ